MTSEELSGLCAAWNGTSEAFHKIVEAYLYGENVDTHARKCKLADEFETMQGTPLKWAEGTVSPRARMQKLIVAFIGENVRP